MTIEIVYEELRKQGLVKAGSDFSENWLGMQEGYYRGLRNKRRDPSAKALATCAVRLKRHARMLEVSTFPQVQLIADRYDKLADQCVEGLLATCDGKDNGYAHR